MHTPTMTLFTIQAQQFHTFQIKENSQREAEEKPYMSSCILSYCLPTFFLCIVELLAYIHLVTGFVPYQSVQCVYLRVSFFEPQLGFNMTSLQLTFLKKFLQIPKLFWRHTALYLFIFYHCTIFKIVYSTLTAQSCKPWCGSGQINSMCGCVVCLPPLCFDS